MKRNDTTGSHSGQTSTRLSYEYDIDLIGINEYRRFFFLNERTRIDLTINSTVPKHCTWLQVEIEEG